MVGITEIWIVLDCLYTSSPPRTYVGLWYDVVWLQKQLTRLELLVRPGEHDNRQTFQNPQYFWKD